MQPAPGSRARRRFPDGETRTQTGDTTIFQSWTAIPLTGLKVPQIPRVHIVNQRRDEVRNVHSFLADSGTETHFGA
jgi:hypothetical protein